MSREPISRCLLSLALTLVGLLSFADIRYTVTPMADVNKLKIQMAFEAKAGPLELQMPNWAPGAYILSMPGRNVADFALKDSAGAVAFEKVGENTWKANLARGGAVAVDYTAPCSMNAGAMHYSGPSTYLYVVGRKEEDCKLSLNVAKGWGIAVGLDGSGTEY